MDRDIMADVCPHGYGGFLREQCEECGATMDTNQTTQVYVAALKAMKTLRINAAGDSEEYALLGIAIDKLRDAFWVREKVLAEQGGKL